MQLCSTEAQALVIRHPTSSAGTLRPCTLRWPLRADFKLQLMLKPAEPATLVPARGW